MTTTINNNLSSSNANLSSSAVTADSMSVNGKPRPAHLSIMSLISEIIKIDDKLRDTQYQYSIEQQENAYNESMDSYNKQSDAAAGRKRQGIMESCGGFLNAGINVGLLSLDGLAKNGLHGGAERTKALDSFHKATAGGDHQAAEMARSEFFTKRNYDLLDGSRNRMLSHITGNPEVFGTLGGSTMGIFGKNAAADASKDDRLSELDKTIEKYFEKDADSYAQKARSVSSEMRQAINTLVQIESKLSDAINIR